jgi:hypothetical protein
VASLAILIIPSQHARIGEPLPMWQQWLENGRFEIATPVLFVLPFLMLLLAILMVTRVRYPHIGDRVLRGKKSLMHLMLLGLAIVLTIMLHEIMLALAFNGYMLFGILNELRYQLIPSHRPLGWDVEADSSQPIPATPALSATTPLQSSTPSSSTPSAAQDIRP